MTPLLITTFSPSWSVRSASRGSPTPYQHGVQVGGERTGPGYGTPLIFTLERLETAGDATRLRIDCPAHQTVPPSLAVQCHCAVALDHTVSG